MRNHPQNPSALKNDEYTLFMFGIQKITAKECIFHNSTFIKKNTAVEKQLIGEQ